MTGERLVVGVVARDAETAEDDAGLRDRAIDADRSAPAAR